MKFLCGSTCDEVLLLFYDLWFSSRFYLASRLGKSVSNLEHRFRLQM